MALWYHIVTNKNLTVHLTATAFITGHCAAGCYIFMKVFWILNEISIYNTYKFNILHKHILYVYLNKTQIKDNIMYINNVLLITEILEF